MLKVRFLNQMGNGYAETVDVEEGSTVGELFASKMPAGSSTSDYTIMVNRLPVTRTQALNEGDAVSVTPNKVTGA